MNCRGNLFGIHSALRRFMSHKFDRRWLLIAGTPLMTNCWLFWNSGDCGKSTVVSWDGKLSDGGAVSYDDAGVAQLGYSECVNLCNGGDGADGGIEYNSCSPSVEGGKTLDCRFICVGGRAPPGLEGLSAANGSAGSWISRMAELEQAAVYAFLHTAQELDAHGIHDAAEIALTAAQHEISHADQLTHLALRMGHCPRPVRIQETPIRSLAELALDNAAEGCGRELFGAALNAHQAEHAGDERVRFTMAAIAGDEAKHAEFSMELSRLLSPRLSLAQRRRLREGQEQVLSQLSHGEMPEKTRRLLGLPDPSQALSLVSRLLQKNRV